MIESLLLTAVHVLTFGGERRLTNASGFFFERDGRLFLVTSRHVMTDEGAGHFPDRVEIELHVNPDNIAESAGFSIPLYRGGMALWRQGLDAGGEVDVALIEIERSALPKEPSIALSCPRTSTVRPKKSRSALRSWWWAFRSVSTIRCTMRRSCAGR